MLTNQNLLKINGQIIPELMEYKVARNKIWKDAQRNMAGGLSATFIGIVPKLEIKCVPRTKARLQAICDLLDTSFFTVEYYDPKTDTIKTQEFYASDYSLDLIHKTVDLITPFTVKLIAVNPE